MSFSNSSQVKIPLTNPYVKYGKTFRVSNIYLTSSNLEQTVKDLQPKSTSRSNYHQDFQTSDLDIRWEVIDPRNDYVYKNPSDIEKNVYISGFNINIYENYGNLTGQNAINNGTLVYSESGAKGNQLNYKITGEDYSRNYSVQIDLIDFTGNVSSALLTTQNQEPNFSVLSTGLTSGVFYCNYSGLTGSNGQNISNDLQSLELYNFTGSGLGIFPDISEKERCTTGANGYASIELTPGVENYVMAIPRDLYSSGHVSGFFKPQEYYTGIGFSGFIGSLVQPNPINYNPEISNLGGYRISGGDAYYYEFNADYNTGSDLLTTCYGVTGTGQTTGSVMGYDDPIFFDSGELFNTDYNYSNTGNLYIYDNSLKFQAGFNTGRMVDVPFSTGLGFTGSGTFGSGAGEYWADSFPRYTGYVSTGSNGGFASGGFYNYGYYDSSIGKFKCASYLDVKSGENLNVEAIYSMPKNNPNSYDIQYHSGPNFQKTYEQSASYLNSIDRMPAVVLNPSQLNKINSLAKGNGWVGLRRNEVGVTTGLFSEDFSNQSFFDGINIQEEVSRDIEITNLTGGIEHSRLEINDVGLNWCWTNSSGTHIYKYAGSGYEKVRQADIALDIKRKNQNADEVIFNTGFTAESPLMEINNLTGISGGLAISFEYDFKNQYYGSGIDESTYTNYNIIQADLYTGDSYGFTASTGNLYESFGVENIEALQSALNFQYTEASGIPPSFFKILPYDTIGPGVMADANKIIAESKGQDPETPIKLVNDDQITVVNLDGMRAVNQNFIEVKFPFGHSVDPIVTFGIEYNGASPPASYLGAMVVGKPTKERVSFLLTDVPPSNGYSLYVRSASGTTETRQFNFTPWAPTMSSLVAWYDVSDNSTLTINSGIVEAIADKSLNNNSLLAGSSSVKNQTLIPGGQNSLDVVSMDGDDNYVAQNMNLPSSGNLCIFMVCKIDAIDSPLDSILSAIGPTSFQFAAGNVSEFRGQLAANGIGGSDTGVSTHGNLGGVYRIFALTMDFTSSQQCLIYADGTDITNTPIAYTTKLGSPKTFRVFANRSNAESPSGFISEVVFVENTDETTRQKIEGYLAHKWGTTDKLPSSHPYKVVIPQA